MAKFDPKTGERLDPPKPAASKPTAAAKRATLPDSSEQRPISVSAADTKPALSGGKPRGK